MNSPGILRESTHASRAILVVADRRVTASDFQECAASRAPFRLQVIMDQAWLSVSGFVFLNGQSLYIGIQIVRNFFEFDFGGLRPDL